MAVAGEVCTDGSRAPRARPGDRGPPGRRPAAGGRRGRRRHHPRARALPLRAPPTARARSPATPGTPRRSPAGSSGGSAAAVAAGCVPLAHGNDGMGSLRLPPPPAGWSRSSPGRGVVPAGIGADSWSGMAENGALATTVADLAAGARGAGRRSEPAPPAAPGRPLRIAVSTRSPVPGVRADAADPGGGRRGGRRSCGPPGTPSSAGTRRSPRPPPLGALARWMAGADDDAEALGPRPARRCSRAAARTPGSAGWSAGPGWSGRAPRERSASGWPASSTDVDVLLTPVTTGPPLPARPVARARRFLANVTANARWAPWAAAWNLAGPPGAGPARPAPAGGAAHARSSSSARRGRSATTLAGRRAGAPAAVAPLRTRLRSPPRARRRRPPERRPTTAARRPGRVTRATPGHAAAAGTAAPTRGLGPDVMHLATATDRDHMDRLVVRGAREHNLKDVHLDLPRDALIVFTGLSGLGQVQPGLRHDLRRGAAPLRRVAVGLRPPVPRPDGQAGRRLHRGPVAGRLDRPEVDQPQPAVDRRHDHRGLRLPAAALRPRRPAALPELRQADLPADPAADRRPGAGHGGGHPLPGARPGRPGPQGRVRRPVQLAADPGLLPRPGRRRRAPADRAAEAQEAGEAHDRGDRRPADGQGERQAPADRLGRDRARPGRRPRRPRLRRPRRGRPAPRAHLLRAPGLRRRRAVLRGARAAVVLLQLAVRRLPRVHRHRHPQGGRPRARRPRPGEEPRRRARSPRGPAR